MAIERESNKNTLPFANDLVFAIVKERLEENIIVSPVGLQACLALVYVGAEDQTFKELDTHLKLGELSKLGLLEQIGRLLTKDSRGKNAIVKMANRMYLHKTYEISKDLNQQAKEHLDIELVNGDFENKKDTAKRINHWVETKTEMKIRNIIEDSNIKQTAAALLVSAMYLQAKWISTFDTSRTTKTDFFIRENVRQQVEMMYQTSEFLYGELKELDATAIELAFVDTHISMLILLPKLRCTLQQLEEKLQLVDITQLTQSLSKTSVHFYLPKFKIECSISLQPVLEKLGMLAMFTQTSNLGTLLAVDDPLSIGLVKQKTCLEINEVGTDIVDNTYDKSSMNLTKDEKNIPELIVNHPFFFVIKDDKDVYFTGHVVTI